ncbi:MAG: glycogen debranching protein GlgX [Vicinamibacteria bacterium]|nr:glycogen debranching protein GlgX [Vicinamibacteria bacterium]
MPSRLASDPRVRLSLYTKPDFAVRPGKPLPLGLTPSRHGHNFAIVSRHATAATLVLYAIGDPDPFLELPLEPPHFRTGDVWHVCLSGLENGFEYGWRFDRRPAPRDHRHRYDPSQVLLDPYARAINSVPVDGRSQKRGVHVWSDFDWQLVRPPRVPAPDKIVYEMHVRGFTRHPSSGAAHPGTYRGLIETIPYLKELGITTVELLPVYEKDDAVNPDIEPALRDTLTNFWGYNPIGFFAPHAAYAADDRHGRQVEEFKLLVRELHRAGLEVILDVVFNHTAEGGGLPRDRTFSFRGIDNSIYYMLDPKTGKYRDYTGCGNTLNCNHPVVRELVLDALRYWGSNMGVDGFRFDLAAVLSRGRDGNVLADPPLIETIADDPVLADLTLIAEAWDAAGLYQVGTFPAWGRWCEWNGPFRDDVRRFVRGDLGMVPALASRLAGSSDIYQASGRKPYHSINFVTCHDGFTLHDLVSFEHKRNEPNGEQNRDGTGDNLSWNCGAEGPTDDPQVLALRRQQVRNLLTLLFVSQGTPMLLAGDELGRTQRGNNNAYCHDNDLSWIDWRLKDENADLHRFTRLLIAFRRAHPVLRRTEFFTGQGTTRSPRPDVSWHGVKANAPDFSHHSRALAMHLAGEHAPTPDDDVYLAVNASKDELRFELPPPAPGTYWVRVIDTARPGPDDIAEPGQEPPVPARTIHVAPHSAVVLRSRL